MGKIINSFHGPYYFLSNFSSSPIKLMCVGGWEPWDKDFGEYTYPTIEHYYQTNKTSDYERRDDIRLSHSAGESKRRGNDRIKTKLRHDWEAKKFQVMRVAIAHKFEPGSELAMKLLGTGDALLVEGNTWKDTFWGVDDELGGQNWLGYMLMAQRAILRGKI